MEEDSLSQHENMNRRTFLKRLSGVTAGAMLAPTIVPSTIFSQNSVPPSERLVMAAIGTGGQGTNNIRAFLRKDEAQIVAVCDVDERHQNNAKQVVDAYYGNSDCETFTDFRELTRRDDIDVVSIGTPDHWHTLPAIDAARNGKDSYVEKPLTLTIEEGIQLRHEVEKYGSILQTGSQQRSDRDFRFACELVRNGYIGEVQEVKVTIPGNNRTTGPTWEPMAVPEPLDYNFWLGPAKWEPYHEQRCHYQFRFILDYSGGQVTNWGAHYLDIAQWGLGMDDSGPVEIWGEGKFPDTGIFTTATEVDFTCRYDNDVILTCKTGGSGTEFIGSEGRIFVNRGTLRTDPESLMDQVIKPNEIHLYKSNDHHQDFLNSVKSRTQPIANIEVGHRSATICHLGNIAMLTKRHIEWDPVAETFPNDSDAENMKHRPMRSPWGFEQI